MDVGGKLTAGRNMPTQEAGEQLWGAVAAEVRAESRSAGGPGGLCRSSMGGWHCTGRKRQVTVEMLPAGVLRGLRLDPMWDQCLWERPLETHGGAGAGGALGTDPLLSITRIYVVSKGVGSAGASRVKRV